MKVDRSGLPAARFQDQLPPVGAFDLVMGSPLGFEKTVTAGIVSGLHRAIPGSAQETPALVDLIQTDAPISPGNSGGAMVDGSGDVIGISVAYIPPQQGAVALGFAIPAATATRVADELIKTGRASHAFLGIQPADVTPEIARELGVKDARGVLVYAIEQGGPAARPASSPAMSSRPSQARGSTASRRSSASCDSTDRATRSRCGCCATAIAGASPPGSAITREGLAASPAGKRGACTGNVLPSTRTTERAWLINTVRQSSTPGSGSSSVSTGR